MARHVLYLCYVWSRTPGGLAHLVGLDLTLDHKRKCQATSCFSLRLSFALCYSALETTTCPRYPGYLTLLLDTLFNHLLGLLCPKNEPEARPRSKSVCAQRFSCPSRTRVPRPMSIAHQPQTSRRLPPFACFIYDPFKVLISFRSIGFSSSRTSGTHARHPRSRRLSELSSTLPQTTSHSTSDEQTTDPLLR